MTILAAQSDSIQGDTIHRLLNARCNNPNKPRDEAKHGRTGVNSGREAGLALGRAVQYAANNLDSAS